MRFSTGSLSILYLNSMTSELKKKKNIYIYIHECGGRVLPRHKVLNSVVAELSIHKLKN